ncbi:hypothetical protein SAY86_026184 [Trapa natans]|uniref:Uncharacterized protein n=1 Tax=Trapa natans TaxID=22666 RepID=A0AAN7QEI1_TRANT|nr:hypothetical protein SAY86_026184 [Trapa natans]
MTTSFIGPHSKGDYLYDIVAMYDHSYFNLQIFTKSIQEVFCDLQVGCAHGGYNYDLLVSWLPERDDHRKT